MKKLRTVLLSAAIVLIGAGVAFATNAAKNTGGSLVPGYLMDNSTGQCVQKRNNCSPTGSIFCTWTDNNKVSHNLSKINGTSCVQALYEP